MVNLYYAYKNVAHDDVADKYDQVIVMSRSDELGNEYVPLFTIDPRRALGPKAKKLLKEDVEIGVLKSLKDFKSFIEAYKHAKKIGEGTSSKKLKIIIDDRSLLSNDAKVFDVSSVKLLEKNMKKITESVEFNQEFLNFILKNSVYYESSEEVFGFCSKEFGEFAFVLYLNSDEDVEDKYKLNIIYRPNGEYFDEVIYEYYANNIELYKKIIANHTVKILNNLETYSLKKVLQSDEEGEFYKNLLIKSYGYNKGELEYYAIEYKKYKDITIREMFEFEDHIEDDVYEILVPNLGSVYVEFSKIKKEGLKESHLSTSVENNYTYITYAFQPENSDFLETIQVLRSEENEDTVKYIVEYLETILQYIKYVCAKKVSINEDKNMYMSLLMNYYGLSSKKIKKAINNIKKVEKIYSINEMEQIECIFK